MAEWSALIIDEDVEIFYCVWDRPTVRALSVIIYSKENLHTLGVF